MRSYFADMVRERLRRPRDDLVGSLASALQTRQLDSEQAAVGLTLLIVTAGTETTTALISSSLLALDAHRDQRALLVDGRTAFDDAIEELLRFESPIQMLARSLTREVELHQCVIPLSSRVVLLYGAANRDERRFDDPDRLDLDRERRRHLAFGEGIHFCLGAPLARLEGRVALECFLGAFPEYAVSAAPEYHHKHNARALARLPAVLHSRRTRDPRPGRTRAASR
jgi:cytochrome P450